MADAAEAAEVEFARTDCSRLSASDAGSEIPTTMVGVLEKTIDEAIDSIGVHARTSGLGAA